MKQDSQRTGIRSKNDKLSSTAIQGFGGLISSLLELTVMGSLLDKVEDVLSKSLVGDGPS